MLPGPGVRVRRPLSGDPRRQQVHAAETRLLYDNAGTGIIATILIASLLAFGQRNVTRPAVVIVWLLYVLLVSGVRYVLVRRYASTPPALIDGRRWSVASAGGAAMAASGWVAGAIRDSMRRATR